MTIELNADQRSSTSPSRAQALRGRVDASLQQCDPSTPQRMGQGRVGLGRIGPAIVVGHGTAHSVNAGREDRRISRDSAVSLTLERP